MTGRLIKNYKILNWFWTPKVIIVTMLKFKRTRSFEDTSKTRKVTKSAFKNNFYEYFSFRLITGYGNLYKCVTFMTLLWWMLACVPAPSVLDGHICYFGGKSQIPHNLSRGNIATDIGYKVKDQVVQLYPGTGIFKL